VNALRTSRFVASLVLAWFVLFIGAAVASPHGASGLVQEVCSTAGVVKLIDLGGDEHGKTSTHGAGDCPLCSAVPPVHLTESTSPRPLAISLALGDTGSAQPPGRTAPPLPSRGPPARDR